MESERIQVDIEMNHKEFLNRYNPAVSKYWLIAVAGAMWTGVGLMLCKYAYTWLAHPPIITSYILGVVGICIAITAYRLQFTKLAKKNISRIMMIAGKVCIFSFQMWKGYLIIIVMITGGILLRNSTIPKPYLAVLYAGIGGALFLSSSLYYGLLIRKLISRGNKRNEDGEYVSVMDI
jgi:uncharacterized membrane protein